MGHFATDTGASSKKTLLILFVAALGIRLLYFFTLEIDDPIRADAFKYFVLAFNLVNHGVYSQSNTFPLEPSTLITPGYPLFLASIMFFSDSADAFGRSTLVVQAILSSFSCVLLFVIGRRVLPFGLALFCSALLIISPHSIIGSGYLLTETLFIFLCLASIYSLCRSEELAKPALFLVTGFLFALAALVRPGLMLFPLAIAAVLIFHSGTRELAWLKLRQMLLLALGFAALFGPWLLWANVNKSESGTSPIAEQIALGSYPNLIHEREDLRGIPYREDPAYAEMAKSVPNALSVVVARIIDEPWRYALWYLLGKPIMFHQPSMIVGQGGAFIFPVKKSLYDVSTVAYVSYASMMFLHPIMATLAALASIAMLIQVARRRAPPEYLALTIVASLFFYFTALHVLLAPLPRYSIPLHPCIYLLAAAAIDRAGKTLSSLT